MDKNNVMKIAIDAIQGRVNGNFSSAEVTEVLRKELIEANGGSDKLSLKTFHRGNAVFEIVEAILPYIIEEGLRGDEFFMQMVDYRNVAEGDELDFVTEDPTYLVVADIGHGTQSVRRQRLDAGERITIPTKLKAVKVYEEWRRLLAGRIDFNTLIDRVSVSFTRQMREDLFAAFNGITANTSGLNSDYVVSGTYDENKLLTLVAHVEAATGKNAVIVGTKAALRKVTTATVAHEAETDMYSMGYYGKFNGADMVMLKQAHKIGTTQFLLDDTKLYVVAADDKFVKCVNEGEGLMIEHDPTENADLTKELNYLNAA